jgi:hypothetical protein
VAHGAERFGEVTALGAVGGAAPDLVAVGGPRHVALAPVTGGGLGPWRWEREVAFRVAVLIDDGAVLWAAGPDADGFTDDYDWEQLRGGGFAALDRADGTVSASGPLPPSVAWGTGGVAVVPIGGRLAVLARDGAVHVVDPARPAASPPGATPTTAPPATAPPATAPLAASSLGIAHAALVGGRVVAGFNRRGYRLHAWAPPGPRRRA